MLWSDCDHWMMSFVEEWILPFINGIPLVRSSLLFPFSHCFISSSPLLFAHTFTTKTKGGEVKGVAECAPSSRPHPSPPFTLMIHPQRKLLSDCMERAKGMEQKHQGKCHSSYQKQELSRDDDFMWRDFSQVSLDWYPSSRNHSQYITSCSSIGLQWYSVPFHFSNGVSWNGHV